MDEYLFDRTPLGIGKQRSDDPRYCTGGWVRGFWRNPKRKFASRAHVLDASADLFEKKNVFVYFYECPDCSCWHFTSRVPMFFRFPWRHGRTLSGKYGRREIVEELGSLGFMPNGSRRTLGKKAKRMLKRGASWEEIGRCLAHRSDPPSATF